ncbi:hypothetical protein [Priestia filamentosa]|uniref:hypothetical protein n=1 Tax=Priestia filamentosa TaxID=1402861 RepID=UPI0039820654
MKLYFLDEYLGDIENPKVEGLWMYGTIKPTEKLEKYRDLFESLLDGILIGNEVNITFF